MNIGRQWKSLVPILLLAMLAGGCRSSNNASSNSGVGSKSSIVIGFSDSITGSLANEGKLTHDGYQMWADAVNAKG
ncbi:MAG: hypothetical protein ACR2PL_19785, partial [Dehalococcoidia bacterium]